ncbi:hypothetical protein DPMN_040791 [Dreissena polymorpha]|uniref:Uncharacterized protein n=1 Tax=Dreissena polymorpha TaxID=45954 RepID=A0A9D4CXK8_DREPO|nr:hypothetical protein DPMN_040791 [Dreissena polymorpha]
MALTVFRNYLLRIILDLHFPVFIQQVKKRLREFAQVRCRNLASSLFAYLHDPDVQARIKLWTDLQAPVIEADDFDATKLKGERMIQARIMDEITKWEAGNQIVKTVQDELTHEFKLECKLLTEECTDIQNLIEGDIITPERRLSGMVVNKYVCHPPII